MTTDTIETASEVVDAPAAANVPAVLSPLKRIEAGIAALQQEADELGRAELSVAGLDKAQRALRLRCVTLRTSLDEAYETINRPMLETQRAARKLVADIKAAIATVEEPADRAIRHREAERERERLARIEAERKAEEERKAAEAARIAADRERISGVARLAQRALGREAIDIEAKLRIAVGISEAGLVVDPALQAEADAVLAETLTALRGMLDAAIAHEAAVAQLAAERAAAERRAALLARIADIRAIPSKIGTPRSAAAISFAIEALMATVVDGEDWGELAGDALAARDAAAHELRNLLATAREDERLAAERAAEQAKLDEQRRQQEAEAERLAEQQRQQQAEAERQRQAAEEAERARVARHRAVIDAISEPARRLMTRPNTTVDELALAITEVEAITIPIDDGFEEFTGEAVLAKARTLRTLRELRDDAIAAAAQAAEQQRQAEEAAAAQRQRDEEARLAQVKREHELAAKEHAAQRASEMLSVLRLWAQADADADDHALQFARKGRDELLVEFPAGEGV